MTVKPPLPKMIVPVPDSDSPLLRLMAPPVAAVMVPWQMTWSLIAPVPEKPWFGDTFSGDPATWIMPPHCRSPWSG